MVEDKDRFNHAHAAMAASLAARAEAQVALADRAQAATNVSPRWPWWLGRVAAPAFALVALVVTAGIILTGPGSTPSEGGTSPLSTKAIAGGPLAPETVKGGLIVTFFDGTTGDGATMEPTELHVGDVLAPAVRSAQSGYLRVVDGQGEVLFRDVPLVAGTLTMLPGSLSVVDTSPVVLRFVVTSASSGVGSAPFGAPLSETTVRLEVVP